MTGIDSTLQQLESRSADLFLDGRETDGDLPQRRLSVRELRGLLLDRATSHATKNAVWAELAFRAQSHGEDWVLAAVWMMAPGLRRAARRAARDGAAPYADIEAEVLEGFLRELRTVDVDAGGVAARLWWAGYRNGLNARARYTGNLGDVPLAERDALHSHSPQAGHPDFVLDRAVQEGAISADEAELIGRTRLEGEALADAARRLGLGYHACRTRRQVAEERLARYLLVPGPGMPSPAPGRLAQVGATAQAA
ncbi:hypothetical protein ACFXO2_16950 [Streptomyces sp. NPDC059152]|uniref:hypothetical protein n=1 Tax=Streptomyces sp. NPDC059152 TaxID=3346742 RepID=UPI0036CC692B